MIVTDHNIRLKVLKACIPILLDSEKELIKNGKWAVIKTPKGYKLLF
jgi:hypothetical protein